MYVTNSLRFLPYIGVTVITRTKANSLCKQFVKNIYFSTCNLSISVFLIPILLSIFF